MVGGPITSITVTDSGDLYTGVPTVTISLPDADSAAATASVTLNDSGTVTGYTIITDGTYYTGETITGTIRYTPQARFYSLLNKFGGASFRPAGLNINAPLPLNDSSAEGQFRTWVYVPQAFVDDSNTQEVMAANAGDINGDTKISAQIRTVGDKAYWDVLLYDSAGGPSVFSLPDSASLNIDDWTFVGIDVQEKDSDEYFISPVQETTRVQYARPKTNIHMYRDSATFFQLVHRGLHFDDLHFVKNYDSSRFESVPTAAMDSIGTDTILLADFDTPRLVTPRNVSFQCPLVDNRLSSIPLPTFDQIDSNEIIDSAYITIGPPTGSKELFRATATASYDSDTRKITGITITDSGDFYITAPSITISAPTGVVTSFIADEIITATADSGYTVSAIIHNYSDSDRVIEAFRISNDSSDAVHLFKTGMLLTGSTSGAQGYISSLAERVASAQDAPAEIFDTSSDDLSFLDFSEDNPFGDPR